MKSPVEKHFYDREAFSHEAYETIKLDVFVSCGVTKFCLS